MGVTPTVWAVCLAILTLLAATVSATGAEAREGPAPPAAPAFYTVSLGRIKRIGPDTFDVETEADTTLQVRLSCADCTQVDGRRRASAETVATSILRAKPVWVFPCGSAKDAGDPAVWACVWTDKGWLGEVLVRAGYALRRPTLEASAMGPPPTVEVPPQKVTLPAAGAFVTTALTAKGADVFEAQRGGRPVTVRLYDVTCRAAPDADAVAATAKDCLSAGPVWVFPCGRVAAGKPLPVRVWTAKGWLGQTLVGAGLAQRLPDPMKPDEGVATAKVDPGETPSPPEPGKTEPPADPVGPVPPATSHEKPKIRWTPVALAVAKMYHGSMAGAESKVFEVPYGVLRLAWDCAPSRQGGTVILNVYRVDDKWSVRTSSHHIASMKGRRGQQVVRGRPGRYWVKLACSAELDGVRVEIAEPME